MAYVIKLKRSNNSLVVKHVTRNVTLKHVGRRGPQGIQGIQGPPGSDADALVSSVNGEQGDVVLTQDDVLDGTTYKQYSQIEKTKLAGIAIGATANSSDAILLARANHTGTQAISTVSGLQAAIDAKEDLANKSTSTSLGSSDTLYPSQNAVKSYVDTQISTVEGSDVDSFNGRTGTVISATDDYTWAQINKATSNIADITTKSHTSLTDIGTNTHPQIDTHIASTSNPHSVTKTQVGLGNVDNTSDANKPVSTATQTELDLKATIASLTAHEADTTSVHGITDTSTLYRTGGTDVAIADGGTGASTAATARTNLGAQSKTFVTVGTADADYITDGVTDNVEIQAALDAVNTAGGGTIFFKKGTYNVTTLLTIGSNTQLIGEEAASTIIKKVASQNASIMINKDTTNGNSFIKIKDITFDQQGASQTAGGGCSFTGLRDSTLENVIFEKSKVFNLFVGSLAGTLKTGTITITNGDSTVTGSSTLFTSEFAIGDIIKTNGARFVRVQSITSDTSLELDRAFGHATETGVTYRLVPPNARNKLLNCYFKGTVTVSDNLGLGLFDDSLVQGCVSRDSDGGYGFGPDHAHRTKFIGNTCIDNDNSGIGLETCGYCVIANNVSYGGGNGIYLLSGSYRNIVTGNECRNNQNGIQISYNNTGFPKPDENQIINNICEINSGHGIRIGGASRTNISYNRAINNNQEGIVLITDNASTPDNNVIQGNICYDNQDTKTQDRGIRIINGSSNVITDNFSNTADHTTSGLTDAGTSTVIINTNGTTNDAGRLALGLGTIAIQAASSVAITGGSITGITDIAVADGGTGASDASAARTNLGLAIGTNVQAWDADLDTIAGLTATTDSFIQAKSNAWASRTVAQVKTDLGLTGTNSGDQTSIVGITGTTAQFNTALTDNDFATLAGTEVLTNKAITPRVVSMADATSITPTGDTADVNTQTNTQAAGTLTANAPSGTPVDEQKLVLRIKSTNAQTWSWNAVYRGSNDVTLPTSTTGSSKTDRLGFVYNSADAKWSLVAKSLGYT